VCRWRAQLIAWFNVNCISLWTSTTWTHIAVIGSLMTMFVWGSTNYLSSHLMSWRWIVALSRAICSAFTRWTLAKAIKVTVHIIVYLCSLSLLKLVQLHLKTLLTS